MLCSLDTDSLILFSFGFDPMVCFFKMLEECDILKDIVGMDNFGFGWQVGSDVKTRNKMFVHTCIIKDNKVYVTIYELNRHLSCQ
jgi:hypothetical protein